MTKTILTSFLVLLGMLIQAQDDALELDSFLDEWHQAAARADFEAYFGKMTDDAVFIGTDATEYWQGDAFREFSRPYFDKGKAWSFSAVERHIYENEAHNLAWFDELLDTRMGLCRGSGIIKKVEGDWKIAHYVLSIAVPNDNVNQLLDLKAKTDSLLITKLRGQ